MREGGGRSGRWAEDIGAHQNQAEAVEQDGCARGGQICMAACSVRQLGISVLINVALDTRAAMWR